VGSGNLHKGRRHPWRPVPRSHRPMRTSLSTLQGSRLDAARVRVDTLAAGRAAPLLSRGLPRV
jgi:hypothetical protein